MLPVRGDLTRPLHRLAWHMPPGGSCVLWPPCQDGCEVSHPLPALSSWGPAVLLWRPFGLLDPASRWRLGHTACSGGQGHPKPHVAAFLRLLTVPGMWLGPGVVPTSGRPGGQLGLGRRRRGETLEPVWFLSPSRLQTSLGRGHVAISVFAPAWFRSRGSCPVFSDPGITWLLPGDSEMPLGESLCTLQGCCGIR